jgi:glycosyltransferase involved in cell wall biosynthesis
MMSSNRNERPLFSIVLPTYNHAEYLGCAIKSILSQTYSKWELIIIDNHSTDNTCQILEDYVDTRIKVLKINNNGIIAKSRNLGIERSNGYWIAFLDSDDYWYPDRLQTLYLELGKNPYADVMCTNEILIDRVNHFDRLLRYGPYCDGFYKRLLIKGNCLSPSATIVNKEFLMNNNICFREAEEFVTAEDFDFWLLLARANANFAFIDQVLGAYIIHGKNNSSQELKNSLNTINVLRDHAFNLQTFEVNKDSLWRDIYSRFLILKGLNCIRKLQFLTGVLTIFRAITAGNMGTITYLGWLIKNRLLAKG